MRKHQKKGFNWFIGLILLSAILVPIDVFATEVDFDEVYTDEQETVSLNGGCGEDHCYIYYLSGSMVGVVDSPYTLTGGESTGDIDIIGSDADCSGLTRQQCIEAGASYTSNWSYADTWISSCAGGTFGIQFTITEDSGCYTAPENPIISWISDSRISTDILYLYLGAPLISFFMYIGFKMIGHFKT